jgi:hypothetical protein
MIKTPPPSLAPKVRVGAPLLRFHAGALTFHSSPGQPLVRAGRFQETLPRAPIG